MSLTWKWFDLLIVVGAVVIGVGVWFIPPIDSDPEVQAFYAKQREIKERRLAREAEAARIAQEREELGLVFIPPPPETADK
jgi:hypothetical protein